MTQNAALAIETVRPLQRSRLRINGYFFFLAPGVLIVLALTLFPALYGIYISLTNLNLGYVGSSFVGIENYIRFFTWQDLALVARNTAVFVGTVVILQACIGLAVAILLNQKLIGHQFMRSITILPWVLPSVVVGLVFAQIFGGSRLGIVNYLLSLVGIHQMSWFADPALAMTILICVSTWRGVPFSVIMMLGGLQTLPRDIYEAAAIDGATAWQRFRYITLPMLSPTIFFIVVISFIGAFQIFEPMYIMTRGGPDGATASVVQYLYETGFRNYEVGYAASIGLLVFVAVLAATLVQFLLRRKWVFEG